MRLVYKMGEISLMLKLSAFLILLSINSYAVSVLISKESLNYEELITTKKLRIVNVSSLKKACIPVKLSEITNNKYLTTHYINKGSVLCQRDIKLDDNKGVLFNFGSIQIEKKGKIIFENDKFIRIKNKDGSIEKIYKDGRLK